MNFEDILFHDYYGISRRSYDDVGVSSALKELKERVRDKGVSNMQPRPFKPKTQLLRWLCFLS